MVVPSGSPLNYPTNTQPVLRRVSRNAAPTANDYRNFREGDEWLDKSANRWYKLADITGANATWIALGSGSGGQGIESITTADSTVVQPTANNVNMANGAGISITGAGDTITITNTSLTGVTWSVITSATKTIVVNEAYFANRGAGVAFTLPAASSVGDSFYLSAIDAGGWTLAQNAGQSIRFGSVSTTVGGGGSLATSAIGNTIHCVCAVANTTWVVVASMGNITYV